MLEKENSCLQNPYLFSSPLRLVKTHSRAMAFSPSLSLTNPNTYQYHASLTCSSFQIPNKNTQIPCLTRKNSVFMHPIKFHQLGCAYFLMGIPLNQPVDQTKKMMTVNAAEVVAETSKEQASSESKPKKKGEKAKYPRRILDVYQILQNPIITESAIKCIADENALLFNVNIRADKKMIRDAFTNFFGVKVRKVNTSIRPDGTKKAFIMLSKEFNASDIAKSIGIFPK